MKRKVLGLTIKCTIGVGIILAAYACGAGMLFPHMGGQDIALAQSGSRSLVTPTVEARLVESHTVEYVQEKVIEKEYVDVIREVKTELHNFATLDDMQAWVEDECLREIVRFRNSDQVIDCDDYALEMQKNAIEDGYIISFEIIDIEEYNELFAIPLPDGESLHAINLAIIENSVFYIEPQTGEIVHAAYLD